MFEYKWKYIECFITDMKSRLIWWKVRVETRLNTNVYTKKLMIIHINENIR